MDRSDIDNAFTALGAVFIVLAQAAITPEPTEGAFNYPGDGGDTIPERSPSFSAAQSDAGVDDWTDADTIPERSPSFSTAQSAVGADWISDADLGSTLEKAQLAAGRQLRPTTTKTKVELVKLLMRGYDKRAIATELGLAPITVNQLRRDIRRHLVTYCRQLGIEPPDATVHTTGWEPGTWRKPYSKRRSPRPKQPTP